MSKERTAAPAKPQQVRKPISCMALLQSNIHATTAVLHNNPHSSPTQQTAATKPYLCTSEASLGAGLGVISLST
jgi:hypothetical protein